MAGFRNSIMSAAGALVRAAIKSPNYVPASSGWTVNKDGSAEFNNLTFRGTFMGVNFVVNINGVFLYSPSEGAGNLIVSVAPAAGVDEFGNNFGAGVNVGNQSAGHVGIDESGRIFLFNAAGQLIFRLNGNTGEIDAFDTAGNLQAVFEGGSAPFGLLGPATAWHPGSIGVTPETWQPITLDAGWTTGGGYAVPQYRMLSTGDVELAGRAQFAAGFTGGKALNSANTLQPGYRPVSSKDPRTGDPVGSRCHISIAPSGIITATPFSGYSSGALFAEIDAIVSLL